MKRLKFKTLSTEELINSHIAELSTFLGIEANLDPKKSPEENEKELRSILKKFWGSIEEQADIFISALENTRMDGYGPTMKTYTGKVRLDDEGRMIMPDESNFTVYSNNLLSVPHLHPYAAILIADRISKKTLKEAKKLIPSSGGKANAAKLDGPTKEIIKAWASGAYYSRDICAEKLWKTLGFKTEGTARRKLRKTPNPSP